MAAVSGKITLTVDGVEFAIMPMNGNESGQVSFQRLENVFIVHFNNFSGSMRVESEATMSFDGSTSCMELADTKTPKTKNGSSSNETPASQNECAVHETPAPQAKRFKSENEKSEIGLHEEVAAGDNDDVASLVSGCPEMMILAKETQLTQDTLPTILGQPDCSQSSQFGSMGHSLQDDMEVDDAQGTEECYGRADSRPESSRVQEIMDEVANASTQMTADSQGSETEESFQHPTPARVSLGGSPVASPSHRQEPPCRRWGHSMTFIGKDRILVYGGQTIDSDTNKPTTLSDIHVFNLQSNTWFQPRGVQTMPRQWHTCSYLPDRQLLVAFGGEATKEPKTPKLSAPATGPSLMVLDCEIMLWYPPVVSGEVPSPRSGHTATLLVDINQLVLFGGVQSASQRGAGGGQKWLNRLSVLDTLSWKWSSPKVHGSPPKPRSYHSATAVKGNRIVVFGGNDADASFSTVHVLEHVLAGSNLQDAKTQWRWVHPTVTGRPPSARTGHSATVLSDNKTICIYGGWDPNADDDQAIGDDDSFMIFDDCFLLDTETWIWKACSSKPLYADVPLHVQGLDGGPRRVGHTAILDDKNERVLVFGGRIPRDRFTGDFQSISL
ncbi:hypothetical protein MPSEU_000723500 [Mayamaea pseudoterrestris]|nr:hypothetical protein MPSEU_000723500 [Mayamaea pseudoterrestris]